MQIASVIFVDDLELRFQVLPKISTVGLFQNNIELTKASFKLLGLSAYVILKKCLSFLYNAQNHFETNKCSHGFLLPLNQVEVFTSELFTVLIKQEQ